MEFSIQIFPPPHTPFKEKKIFVFHKWGWGVKNFMENGLTFNVFLLKPSLTEEN